MIARATETIRNGIENAGRLFMTNRAGNFAMTTALLMPVLLGALGAAVDYVRLVNDQRHLQDSIDSAAVAAAASMVAGKHDATTVKDYAINFVLADLGKQLTATEQAQLKSKLNVTVTSSSSGSLKTYSIKVSGNYTTQLSPFAKFVGYGSMPVGAVSTTQSQSASKNAMSMYVVLDRSGSMSWVTDTANGLLSECQNYVTMKDWEKYPNIKNSSPCYVNKMGAVKQAAASLFTQLDTVEKKDTTDSIVRIGGVSFNDDTQSQQAIEWGTSKIRTYVNNLPAYPTGGTDMTGGMKKAYDALTGDAETNAHTAKGNTSFSKFIVLMTDGENTGNSPSWNPALDVITLTHCTSAKTAGITIYTVAFMAPANGETLLKACASSPSNYYAANDMPTLIKAFADIGNKAGKQATRILN